MAYPDLIPPCPGGRKISCPWGLISISLIYLGIWTVAEGSSDASRNSALSVWIGASRWNRVTQVNPLFQAVIMVGHNEQDLIFTEKMARFLVRSLVSIAFDSHGTCASRCGALDWVPLYDA